MGCASSGTLGGGPEDKTPPRLVVEKSSLNKQTNFRPKEIQLVFDEFITITNPLKEIRVSPPLDYLIQTKVRGKKLTVSFHEKEVLKDEVTYLINFGQAIKDFRAGNVLENFVYVFSTGDKLDSLSISGTVHDFESGQPVGNAVVMLYDQLEDSCILKGKPLYFARTGKNGTYQMDHLKEGRFRLYACTDENGSYSFNIGKEGVGFLSDDIILDSVRSGLDMKITRPAPPLKIIKWQNEYAQYFSIVFNQTLSSTPEVIVPEGIDVWQSIRKDTLNIWYQTDRDSFTVQVVNEENTIAVRQKKYPGKQKLSLLKPPLICNTLDTVIYNASIPISAIDTTAEHTVRDTAGIEIEHKIFVGTDKRTIGLVLEAKRGVKYQIDLGAGLIKDIRGELNDSLGLYATFIDSSSLASIHFIIEQLDSTLHYEVAGNAAGQKILATRISGRSSFEMKLADLPAGDFTLEIFEDRNNNRMWDAHQIFGRRQAEPKLVKTYKGLKANLVREETILWED